MVCSIGCRHFIDRSPIAVIRSFLGLDGEGPFISCRFNSMDGKFEIGGRWEDTKPDAGFVPRRQQLHTLAGCIVAVKEEWVAAALENFRKVGKFQFSQNMESFHEACLSRSVRSDDDRQTLESNIGSAYPLKVTQME